MPSCCYHEGTTLLNNNIKRNTVIKLKHQNHQKIETTKTPSRNKTNLRHTASSITLRTFAGIESQRAMAWRHILTMRHPQKTEKSILQKRVFTAAAWPKHKLTWARRVLKSVSLCVSTSFHKNKNADSDCCSCRILLCFGKGIQYVDEF